MPSVTNAVNATQNGVQTVNSGTWTGSALTQYNVLVGGANSAIISVPPSATSGTTLISQGASANPTFGTATIPGGGTGASSFNINGVLISGATTTSTLTAITLASNGQLAIGATGSSPVAATLTQGTNIAITNAANSITISSSGLASFSWNTVSGTSQACLVNQGYLTNNAAATSLYLPANPSLGSIIRFSNNGSASVKVFPATGQTLNFLYNSFPYPKCITSSDAFSALCVVSASSTDWNVISNEGLWSGLIIMSLSAGFQFFHYNKKDYSSWGVGVNNAGQLGNRTVTSYSSPISVIGNFSFQYLCSGPVSSTAGIDYDNKAWMWGLNNFGQLGTQNTTSYSSPVSVVGGFNFSQISMNASNTTLGLTTTGTAWGWGQNSFGEIGNRTRTAFSSPVSVVGNHSFVMISMGLECSYGLKADGTLWAWGGNTYGELGNRTATSFSSPISVVGNHSFISVVGGYGCALALKANGSVWAWGYNSTGQLGNNTVTSYSSPISVIGAHSFIEIAVAGIASYGLKANGQLWAWGNNAGGELGVGNITNYSSPVQVLGPFSFTALPNTGGGYQFNASMYAANYDGTIWGWGNDGSGQLGNNSMSNVNSPVLVLNTP